MTHTSIPLPLNAGQQAAAEGFFEFLFRPEQKELIISGPGGTGKTHLMSAMIDQIMPRYFQTCQMMGLTPEYDNVHMTATTNKAAEVLAVATQRETSTIQSFLNLKVQDDYTTGQSKLTKTNNWFVHQRKILFVDEASMIDTPLRQLIMEGTHQSKIVYVGDHCQLSPIMESISPIYKDSLPFFELTEQMRTNNSHLQAVNDQLRETVKTGEFKPIRLVPGSIDLMDDADLQRGMEIFFTNQTQNHRILAYTNNRVMQFNDHIRTIRGLPDHYTVGEFLVNNSAIRMKNSMLSVEEEVTITKISDTTEKHMIDEKEDLWLEFYRCTLQSRVGTTWTDVPLPVDRTYFSNLIKYFSRSKRWHQMYHLKNTYPDLRQRDAATVHKAQGSTYDSVFIDLGNISTCHQPDAVARMLYVAFSRARHRVFLYGQLAPKYGGIIS